MAPHLGPAPWDPCPTFCGDGHVASPICPLCPSSGFTVSPGAGTPSCHPPVSSWGSALLTCSFFRACLSRAPGSCQARTGCPEGLGPVPAQGTGGLLEAGQGSGGLWGEGGGGGGGQSGGPAKGWVWGRGGAGLGMGPKGAGGEWCGGQSRGRTEPGGAPQALCPLTGPWGWWGWPTGSPGAGRGYTPGSPPPAWLWGATAQRPPACGRVGSTGSAARWPLTPPPPSRSQTASRRRAVVLQIKSQFISGAAQEGRVGAGRGPRPCLRFPRRPGCLAPEAPRPHQANRLRAINSRTARARPESDHEGSPRWPEPGPASAG